MKFYSNKNVYEKAIERINYILDEFEHVAVGFSGGKDSTVTFNLVLNECKKRGRNLDVIFVDQEAEWNKTIELVREVMATEGVNPIWIQCQIKILNATSHKHSWLHCWEDGAEWLREKEPNSIKENIFGTDRFAELFTAIGRTLYKGEKFCYISGVRAEESPSRSMALTERQTYKWITWGKVLDKKVGQYTFYPLYDWSFTDIWKAIHDNGWKYNEIYDYQYRLGVPVQNMRVSNVHHETAVQSLFYLQEVDKELYNGLTKRLHGIDTAGKMGSADFFPKKLPFMFKSWLEYRDFLFDKLLTEEAHKKTFRRYIRNFDKIFAGDKEAMEKAAKVVTNSIIANDIECTKLSNFNNTVAQFYAREHGIKLKI